MENILLIMVLVLNVAVIFLMVRLQQVEKQMKNMDAYIEQLYNESEEQFVMTFEDDTYE